jgi:hypothetical protein
MEIKQADAIRIGMCPHCKFPHLLLLDEHDEVFAEAVISVEIGASLIEGLQKALYAHAVNKDELK